jgi:hypothetical protein
VTGWNRLKADLGMWLAKGEITSSKSYFAINPAVGCHDSGLKVNLFTDEKIIFRMTL